MARIVRTLGALGVGVALMSASAADLASALTAELANKCRTLAIKAHPYRMPGEKGPATGQAEREYFKECVAKGGNMPDETSTGQGGGGQGAAPAPPK